MDEITSKELLELNTIDLKSCNTHSFSRYPFLYYTSESTASSVFENKSFWANSIDSMNDITEVNGDSHGVHALCFSNTKSEKIPMWYLYSGLLGDGVSITITPKSMIEFINSIKKIYPIINNKPNRRVKLVKDIDFDVKFGWIYYSDHKTRYNYKREWYQLKEEDSDNFIKNNWFIKNYAWEYECEFRIVIINKTNNFYEKIEIPFPKEILSKITITLGPETDREPFLLDSKLRTDVFPYVKKIRNSNIGVNMSLLDRNKMKLLSYFQSKISKWDLSEKEKENIQSTIEILNKYWRK